MDDNNRPDDEQAETMQLRIAKRALIDEVLDVELERYAQALERLAR